MPLFFFVVLVVQVRQELVLKQQCGSVWGRQEAKANWVVQQQQMQQNRGREVGYEIVKCGNRPLTSLPQSQSAWPQLQLHHQNQQLQYSGSGSRVSIPGGSAPKRGCGGTGVFLPRHYGNPPEPRKKTGKISSSSSILWSLISSVLVCYFCV